ncbi:hypothetical protein EC957_005167 [Mortierella hygrophila]|uniref:Uncharacterized protein n=1 Tax=Mortierella hygrophila TaxID=979708 RepID=A0A9P6F1L4_9FUNG|nr:hypothetical protein EC957_005167 [Mortierella hygrophila]
MEDTAINLAHRYVQAAEEHQDRQQWTEAVEMHLHAADQFLLATKDTQDQEVIKTLKFMNANHLRQGKDLQRKLAKAAAEEAAAAAAALAQQQHLRVKNERSNGSSLGTSESSSAGRRRSSSGQHQQGNSGGLGQRRHNVPSSYPSSNLNQHALGELGGEAQSKGGDTGSGGSYLGTSSEASSNSSSAMVEESFTLIKSHGKDKSDPFNRFWEELENLVHKISNPVAFTSIPLDGDDPLQINAGSAVLHSPTSENRPPLSPLDGPQTSQDDLSQADATTKQRNKLTSGSISSRSQPQSRIRIDPSPMQESFFIIDSPSQRNMVARTRSASTSETGLTSASLTGSQPSRPLSSNLRRTETSPRGSKTIEEYAIENQQLKMTLDKLSKRNLKLEKQLEGVMQMSVWTKDVQRSAMQLIKSQDILRPAKQPIQDLSADKTGVLTQRLQQSTAGPLPPSSVSSVTTPTTSYDQMNPTTMQTRLKELEEELQKMKLENAKQNHLMMKYKQRWEDLKESAKRRRNATPTPPEGGSDPSQGGGDFGSPVLSPEPSGTFGGNGGSTPGSNPYSNAALAGNPSGLGQVARPPFSTLSRSSSASGPVVLPGGSYQRRIMMEGKAGGVLDHTPLNMHRQTSAGMVSSTTPRVLDTSPRTNVGSLPFVPEIPRQPMISGATAAIAAVSPARSSPRLPSSNDTGTRPSSSLSPPVGAPSSTMPGSLPTDS